LKLRVQFRTFGFIRLKAKENLFCSFVVILFVMLYSVVKRFVMLYSVVKLFVMLYSVVKLFVLLYSVISQSYYFMIK
jgi:hypothetical protein